MLRHKLDMKCRRAIHYLGIARNYATTCFSHARKSRSLRQLFCPAKQRPQAHSLQLVMAVLVCSGELRRLIPRGEGGFKEERLQHKAINCHPTAAVCRGKTLFNDVWKFCYLTASASAQSWKDQAENDLMGLLWHTTLVVLCICAILRSAPHHTSNFSNL